MNHRTLFAALPVLSAMLLAGCGEEPTPDAAPAEQDPPAVAVATPSPAPSAADLRTAGAEDEAQALAGEKQDVIPVRFHGDWSEDLAHCDEPGHQRYAIRAREVGFFESRGIVQDVDVNGNYAAATLAEQYGDAPPAVYAFYMAIEGPDTMRIRYDDEPRIRIYRCPE